MHQPSNPTALRLAALPRRITTIARHDIRSVASSVRWLATSREHTNFTYDLTDRNREHLAWFVANVTGISHHRAAQYIAEIEGDAELRAAIIRQVAHSPKRGLTDPHPRFGRRVGWYAMVRALRPSVIVETGTDKGLGTLVLAAAVRRNGEGEVITMDLNPEAGSLLCAPYTEHIDVRIGDSVATLTALETTIDVFLHDSDHSAAHEANELAAVQPHLAPTALVLSDNSHVTDELPRWAHRNGRNFLFFDERPANHWYPGGGIGASMLTTGAPR